MGLGSRDWGSQAAHREVKNPRMCRAALYLYVHEVFWKAVDALLFLKRQTAEGNFLQSELNT